MQYYTPRLRLLVQQKEKIIENLSERFEKGELPQESHVKHIKLTQKTNIKDNMSTVNDNIICKEINEQELMKKTEAIAEHTELAIVKLHRIVDKLKCENCLWMEEQDDLVRFYSL